MIGRVFSTAILTIALGVAGAMAEDRALILANENYSDAADIRGAGDLLEAAAILTEAGFVVQTGQDLESDAMRAMLSELLNASTEEDRIVILFAGHVIATRGRHVLLGIEASEPDLASLGGMGIDLAEIYDIAADFPGAALIGIGTETRRLPLGLGAMEPGIGVLEPPQGVAVISGEAGAVARFAGEMIPERGISLRAMTEAIRGLEATGFLPRAEPFRPEVTEAIAPPVPVDTGPTEADRSAEDTAWERAQTSRTMAGYETYLGAYPRGIHAAEARAELNRLRNDPQVQAQMTEEALGLSRDQRRAVQRQLALLGHDPSGIDGLFGQGSRRAIIAWQAGAGLRQTGYLDRDQLTRLSAAAEKRAAELEAEAAARKAEEERQDRIYWDQTGAAGDEVGLRTYLARFPNGLFAELARERLAALEEDARAVTAVQDQNAWDAARAGNNLDAYRAYLAEFPQGAFAAEARARIEALQQETPDGGGDEDARIGEDALGLNGMTRRLIERQLAVLGFDPGPQDGDFDALSREAIRNFQASRNQPATGFIDETTILGLLAGISLPISE
ncbi:MAG: peptidoglycan-binding protein [Pseudorhodobacter sp.]